MGWKLVINNCFDYPKPLRSNSWHNYLKGISFCGGFRVSTHAADQNLLPHLQNIRRDGILCRFLTENRTKKQHIPDPLYKTQKQIENVQDQRIFPWQYVD